MVSRGTECFLAASIATYNRAFRSGSAPPALAATTISLASLPNTCPRLRALASRPFCFHCAPMAVSHSSGAEACASAIAILAAAAADDCFCQRQQSPEWHEYAEGLRVFGLVINLAIFLPRVGARLPHAVTYDGRSGLAII